MTDDTPLPFDLPSVRRKKLTVDFAGGNQSSNGGGLELNRCCLDRRPISGDEVVETVQAAMLEAAASARR